MGWFGHKKEVKATAADAASPTRKSTAAANTTSATASHTANTVTSSKDTSHRRPKETYVAPEPAAPLKEEVKIERQRTLETVENNDALMVVDRPPKKMVGEDSDPEDIEPSYSAAEEESDVAEPRTEYDSARQNHLNSLFNGHLMKWKFEAEEGSPFIRIPAFFSAMGLLCTSIASLLIYPEAWTPHAIILSVCIVIMSIFVLILDGRFLATNPLSARAHLRNITTRNCNIFRFVWGRGLLYIAAGTLSVFQLFIINAIAGAIMIIVGIVALFVGIHASRKFASLRNSLADESFLLLVFSNYDVDGDGYLSPNEFASLLYDLGMELDDRYTLKAFNVIDTDNDRRISFEEFSHWWSSGYIERGRRFVSETDGVYRRLE